MERSSFSDSELSHRKHMTLSSGPLPSARRSLMSLTPHFVSNLSKRTDYKYREAVDRLRQLLQQYSPEKSVRFSPEVLIQNGATNIEPHLEALKRRNFYEDKQEENTSQKIEEAQLDEIVTLLKGQDEYINHLEKENIILRKELSTLEDKIVEVIAENEKLLSANRQTVTKNIIAEVLQLSEDKDPQPPQLLNRSQHKQKTHTDDKDYTDKDTSKPHLCEKCDLEATIQANTAANVTLQRISKERDELLSSNMKLKISLQEMRAREKEAEIQVKKGIELLEETALEKQQVELQNSKLQEDLEKQRKRLEEIIKEYEAKIVAERDLCQKDYSGRLIHAQSKFEEAVRGKVLAEHQFDKLVLEKENLSQALEQSKQCNMKLEKEIGKIITDLKAEVAREASEREQVASELHQLKAVSMREKREQQQEKDRLHMEADVLRRHCNHMEQDLLTAKEESLHLTQAVCELQNMISLEQSAKQSGQRTVYTDITALKERFRSREEQLNNILQQTEDQQALIVNELDTIAASQTGLISQLTNECRFLSENSRHMTKQYKNEIIALRTRVDELSGQLEQSRHYRRNMELQCDQHRHTHQMMRQQLHHLEDKLKKASQQVETLLSSQQLHQAGLSGVQQHYLHDRETLPLAAWNDVHSSNLQFNSV